MGWEAVVDRRGNTKAVGNAEHAGQTLYGEDAQRALQGGGRPTGGAPDQNPPTASPPQPGGSPQPTGPAPPGPPAKSPAEVVGKLQQHQPLAPQDVHTFATKAAGMPLGALQTAKAHLEDSLGGPGQFALAARSMRALAADQAGERAETEPKKKGFIFHGTDKAGNPVRGRVSATSGEEALKHVAAAGHTAHEMYESGVANPPNLAEKKAEPPAGQKPVADIPKNIPATSPDVSRNTKAPWQMSAEEAKKAGVSYFRTGQGSLYAHANGQTIRIKTPHIGHPTADVGLKRPSEKTYFVSPEDAKKIGMWQGLQSHGKRVVVHNGQAHLVSKNPKTGQLGRDEKPIKLHDAPAKGLSPLELNDRSSRKGEDIHPSFAGGEVFGGTHPGSPITEFPEHGKAHAEFVAGAKAAGKAVAMPEAAAQQPNKIGGEKNKIESYGVRPNLTGPSTPAPVQVGKTPAKIHGHPSGSPLLDKGYPASNPSNPDESVKQSADQPFYRGKTPARIHAAHTPGTLDHAREQYDDLRSELEASKIAPEAAQRVLDAHLSHYPPAMANAIQTPYLSKTPAKVHHVPDEPVELEPAHPPGTHVRGPIVVPPKGKPAREEPTELEPTDEPLTNPFQPRSKELHNRIMETFLAAQEGDPAAREYMQKNIHGELGRMWKHEAELAWWKAFGGRKGSPAFPTLKHDASPVHEETPEKPARGGKAPKGPAVTNLPGAKKFGLSPDVWAKLSPTAQAEIERQAGSTTPGKEPQPAAARKSNPPDELGQKPAGPGIDFEQKPAAPEADTAQQVAAENPEVDKPGESTSAPRDQEKPSEEAPRDLDQELEMPAPPPTTGAEVDSSKPQFAFDWNGTRADGSPASGRVIATDPEQAHVKASALGHKIEALTKAGQKKNLLPKKKGKGTPTVDSLLSHVIAHGGIDPTALSEHVTDAEEAKESGLPGSALKSKAKGGRTLDDLAASMVEAGHLVVPEGRTPDEYLLEQLQAGAKSAHASRESDYDRAQEEYYRELEEARQHHAAADVAEAIRAGEAEADRAFGEGAGGEGAAVDRGDAEGADGDLAGEPGGGVGDFDFGANAEEPAREEPHEAPTGEAEEPPPATGEENPKAEEPATEAEPEEKPVAEAPKEEPAKPAEPTKQPEPEAHPDLEATAAYDFAPPGARGHLRDVFARHGHRNANQLRYHADQAHGRAMGLQKSGKAGTPEHQKAKAESGLLWELHGNKVREEAAAGKAAEAERKKPAPEPPKAEPAPEPTAKEAPPPEPQTASGVHFRPTQRAHDSGSEMVEVDAGEMDRAWQKDKGYYLPAGGSSDKVKSQNARDLVADPKAVVEAPEATIDPDGTLSFTDGRHRAAALRDAGKKTLMLTVPKEQAERVRRDLGPSGEESAPESEKAQPPAEAEAPVAEPAEAPKAEEKPVEAPSGEGQPGGYDARLLETPLYDSPTAEPDEEGRESPHVALADALAEKLKDGGKVDAKDLWAAADKAYGGTRAQGKYGPSEAYDALEAGLNKALVGQTDPTAPLDSAIDQAKRLADQVAALPTQTNRSGNKDSFQQFSTPPHYAFAANWLANLRPGETALEPSAGTGSLAVHAKNAGANVVGNEYDPRRADLLKPLLGEKNVHGENAEHLSALMPKRGVSPSVVVMNPPFSQTAGRMGDKKDLMTGANHIEEAMKTLRPGGRLVAIVGRGMTTDSSTFRDWFNRMGQQYNLRANVGVSGDEYKKYGTHFGTRVLVFDKDGPQKGAAVQGDADDIPDLMRKLEGVRNDRPGPAGGAGAPGEQTGPQASGAAQGGPGPADAAAAPTDDRVAGTDAGEGLPVREVPGRSAPGGVPAGAPQAGVGGEPAGGRPGGSRPGTDGGAGGGTAATVGRGPGRPAPDDGQGRDDARRGAKTGGKPVQRPAAPLPSLRPPGPVRVTSAHGGEQAPPTPDTPATPKSNADLGDSLYEQYRPALMRVEGAKPHPTPLVESAAMAAVLPPKPDYTPHFSPDIVEKGILTEPALESVVYAGQAHGKDLPAAEGETAARRGYFVGDGTGAGKGRQIAGIITDNWNQGRKKHVWVSEKQPLFEDAHRDWRDLGNDPRHLFHFDQLRKGDAPPEGVAFVTYDTLKTSPKDPSKPSNLHQLVQWLGKDFDGVIAFDEAHNLANALMTEGERGQKKPSAKALAGIQLQKELPRARVVYVSATGATDVNNLAYAERLGLWGRGTAFPTKQDFIGQMDSGGVAAMEAVAQNLKAMGAYGARSLSFGGELPEGHPQKVTYDRLTHSLSDEQKFLYDSACDGWQKVLQHIDKALEASGGSDNPRAKANAKGQFWGAQQRFFNQLMTAMQTPSVVKSIEDDLKAGRAPVVQLVNTMEAASKRAYDALDEGQGLEEMDVSPKQILMQYLEKSFPVHRHEKYVDENGNELSRPAKDAEGNLIEDPEAVRMRDDMIAMANELKIPESPLDSILNHFGHETVAEATGRTQRLVMKDKPDGTRGLDLERRNPAAANQAEAAAFQSGRKKIMVFSDAGGTGRSYHADKGAGNQALRVHYLLQPGWRADKAVQGLGRTHRTNQAQAPTYRLVEIGDLKAQKRFISTIARRLDQLGALTRGQRQAGSSGLFKATDNLESPEARKALDTFWRDMKNGDVEGLDWKDVFGQMGLYSEEEEERRRLEGKPPRPLDPPPMTQFLNRLLSLKVGTQGQVFDAFDERLKDTVQRALSEGTLDQGVENFPADKIVPQSDKVIHTDQASGAEARHMVVKAIRKVEKRPWSASGAGKPPIAYVRNKRSGRVWSAVASRDKTDAATGRVRPQAALFSPTGATQYTDMDAIPTASWDRENDSWERLDEGEARRLWDEEHRTAPDHTEDEEHFIAGAMLPIWDRLPPDRPKIYRLRTDDGRTVVGRHIPPKMVAATLKKLGAEEGAKSPADVHAKVAAGKHRAILANGWKLEPRMVQGERRIELTGPTTYHRNELEKDGVRQERIGYANRYFVPTGPEGTKVLERITQSRPVTELEPLRG